MRIDVDEEFFLRPYAEQDREPLPGVANDPDVANFLSCR